MTRQHVAALLRILIAFGGTAYVNPYETDNPRINFNQIWAELPYNHVALGGDVHALIHGVTAPSTLRVRLARDDDDGRTLLATMPLALDSENRITLPCGYFSRGGVYYLELVSEIKDNFLSEDYDKDNETENITDENFSLDKREINSKSDRMTRDVKVIETSNSNNDDNKNDRTINRGSVIESSDSIVKSWKFDVLWPSAKLKVTPELIQTYPERPVMAILEFPKVVCTPVESSADFWLELLYCGHSSGGAVLCDGKNTSSHAHVLYSEQVHGFPGRRTMTLRCELFGQAGDYALSLRPAAAAGPQDIAAAFIKADWSEQFVLNVHGGSVFPCGGGVRVLFQYPECVLEGADRVRVFGRDGERLRYVAERRVRRGQHTASFDCRLFSERYPEFCFVYVSQAVTGAVADVRMDCLPTLPLSDGAAGAWGEWSAWSPCPEPSLCSTRTRSRHRFCDSPPPAYGAKYCEGNAVELAACECTARPWAGDSTNVVAEVGPRCRCGCVLHLAPASRLLAGSARACPARSFWLLQAEEGLVVRLRMEAVRLPCAGQALRARDGDSLGSPLLASWDGPDGSVVNGDDDSHQSQVVEIAGGRHILVELRSTDTSEHCSGGFLAHASQIEPIRNASAAWASIASNQTWWTEGGGARAAVLALAAIAALAALSLALHSAHRTRAYQRAADKESLTDTDACSASLEILGAETGSRSTLLSEVVGGGVSLRRLLPTSRAKHTRLRESDVTQVNLEIRDNEEDQPSDIEQEQTDNVSEGSQTTITPEGISSSSAPVRPTTTPSPLRRSHTVSTAPMATNSEITSPPQPSIQSDTVTGEMSTSISSVSERDNDSASEKDKDITWEKDRSESRASSSSAATLTNGWYSPALSGVCAARVRGNPKHSKETSNRRLLRSDLSLTSHPEMEIDYYDYEVNNAGSVPGSYLGMDPAFLVWIPPLEEGDILREIDENKVTYEESVPKDLYPDPGSNKESPETDIPIRHAKSNDTNKTKTIEKTNIIHPLNFSISDLQKTPKPGRRFLKKRKQEVCIPMKELTLSQSPVKVHYKGSQSDINNSTLKRITDTAKEKKENVRNDDIKFADESSESSCDIKFADDDTPDSNIIVEKFNVRV